MQDPVNDNLRASLDEQIAEFMTKGGEITQIATGTSGISTDQKKTHWTRSSQQAKKPEDK